LPGQLLQHLAERGVLSADQRHVVDAEVLKEADVPRCTHDLPSRNASSAPIRRLLPHTAHTCQLPTVAGGKPGSKVTRIGTAQRECQPRLRLAVGWGIGI